MENESEILTFFKATANVERLKIIGVLALEPRSVEQMSGLLNIRPALIHKHLQQLVAAGLVSLTATGYQLDTQAIEQLARKVLSNQRPRLSPDDFEGEDFDRKVLSDFLTPEGRLKSIPSQNKKLRVILKHIAQSFDPETIYTEKQVNAILQQYFIDSASLRRYLVDNGLLAREMNGSTYWRPKVIF